MDQLPAEDAQWLCSSIRGHADNECGHEDQGGVFRHVYLARELGVERSSSAAVGKQQSLAPKV